MIILPISVVCFLVGVYFNKFVDASVRVFGLRLDVNSGMDPSRNHLKFWQSITDEMAKALRERTQRNFVLPFAVREKINDLIIEAVESGIFEIQLCEDSVLSLADTEDKFNRDLVLQLVSEYVRDQWGANSNQYDQFVVLSWG